MCHYNSNYYQNRKIYYYNEIKIWIMDDNFTNITNNLNVYKNIVLEECENIVSFSLVNSILNNNNYILINDCQITNKPESDNIITESKILLIYEKLFSISNRLATNFIS